MSGVPGLGLIIFKLELQPRIPAYMNFTMW